MNIEEALEKIDELNETIEELEQEVEEKTSEVEDTFENITDHYSDSLDKQGQEELAQKSFYAGRNSDLKTTQLKAWLNYKVGERL